MPQTEWAVKCQQCGIIERGTREECNEELEDHDDFHSTRILRPATDGGVEGVDGRSLRAELGDDEDDESDEEDGPDMERVTFRAPPGMVTVMDRAVDAGLYPNRSEAIRDAVRQRFVAPNGGDDS